MQKPSPNRIAFDKIAAMLAILAAASFDYGFRIWMLAGIAFAVSVLTSCLFQLMKKKPLADCIPDALCIGLILLLMLPATISISMVIMSCIFAIIIGRVMFGGKENPVIPPAAVGYCFCLLNNRAQTVSFPAEKEILPLFQLGGIEMADGVSSLWNRGGKFTMSVSEWLTGLPCQPIGTGSIVLLTAVAVVLILRRAASGWVVIPALASHITSSLLISNLQHPVSAFMGSVLTNQLLIAFLFLHVDPEYAPPTLAGIAYGFAVGFASFFATRVLFIYDAPVLMAVLFSPFVIWLRRMMMFEDAEPSAERGTAA